MKVASLFAGVGGFDLALTRLGHEIVYVNEWDKYAAQTYEKNFGNKSPSEIEQNGQRWDGITREVGADVHGGQLASLHCVDTRSITDISTSDIPDHDLLCGGFPCQSFSIAGKRGGFNDTRGTMFFEIARILKDKRPTYLLLENVKGLLSHDNGRTFETIMRTLDELGYDTQWQVLNSKNFGVPQNRERVFIVGHLRGKPRPQVFPIREGNPKSDAVRPEEQRQGAGIQDGYISPTLRSNYYKQHYENQYIQRYPLKFLQRNQRNIDGDYAYTVDSANTGGIMIGTLRTHKDGEGFREMKSGLAPTIPARAREDGSGQPVISTVSKIRRLTPTECERLQGFPDGWTEGVSDTQRYKQMGNAVTVDVVQAVASRLSL